MRRRAPCRMTSRLRCFAGSRPSALTIALVHFSTEKALVRLEDIPQPTRDLIVALECSSLDTRPFVAGPRLPKRRVAIISSAALFARSSMPFMRGATDFRELLASLPTGDILMIRRLVGAPDIWIAGVGSLLTAVLAVVAAFQLSLPDRKAAWASLPLPAAAVWVGASGFGRLRLWPIPDTYPASLRETESCLILILSISLRFR